MYFSCTVYVDLSCFPLSNSRFLGYIWVAGLPFYTLYLLSYNFIIHVCNSMYMYIHGIKFNTLAVMS